MNKLIRIIKDGGRYKKGYIVECGKDGAKRLTDSGFGIEYGGTVEAGKNADEHERLERERWEKLKKKEVKKAKKIEVEKKEEIKEKATGKKLIGEQ